MLNLSPTIQFPITDGINPNGIVWEYGQYWNESIEDRFAPGRVSLGRQGDELLVFADLNDRWVMPDSFPANHPAFLTCDAFEIFLGAGDSNVYHEFHVTPSNSRLQLRFDASEPRKDLKDHAIEAALFFSETWIKGNGWRVLARVPLTPLTGSVLAPLRLSFGRYDHTPGMPDPVISSTSPHTKLNFHRPEEWRSVEFMNLPSVK